MAWRNIEIDFLINGDLLMRSHIGASDQPLAPGSGASEHPLVHNEPPQPPHELVVEPENYPAHAKRSTPTAEPVRRGRDGRSSGTPHRQASASIGPAKGPRSFRDG